MHVDSRPSRCQLLSRPNDFTFANDTRPERRVRKETRRAHFNDVTRATVPPEATTSEGLRFFARVSTLDSRRLQRRHHLPDGSHVRHPLVKGHVLHSGCSSATFVLVALNSCVVVASSVEIYFRYASLFLKQAGVTTDFSSVRPVETCQGRGRQTFGLVASRLGSEAKLLVLPTFAEVVPRSVPLRLQSTVRRLRRGTISAKMITVLTRYRPIVLELI